MDIHHQMRLPILHKALQLLGLGGAAMALSQGDLLADVAQFGGSAIDALFGNTLDTGAHPYYAQLDGLQVSAHFLVARAGRLATMALARAATPASHLERRKVPSTRLYFLASRA